MFHETLEVSIEFPIWVIRRTRNFADSLKKDKKPIWLVFTFLAFLLRLTNRIDQWCEQVRHAMFFFISLNFRSSQQFLFSTQEYQIVFVVVYPLRVNFYKTNPHEPFSVKGRILEKNSTVWNSVVTTKCPSALLVRISFKLPRISHLASIPHGSIKTEIMDLLKQKSCIWSAGCSRVHL